MRKNQLLILFLLLIAGNTYCQRPAAFQPSALQTISTQLPPAYVRMWTYDTTTHQQMSATFSGVVVTKEGHILTVAHTTVPGNTYMVTFTDGRAAIAMALGKINFPETPELPDVAMMKILTPGDWPVAPMGWSYDLKENEPCFSIAYPESLNQPLPMMTAGHITRVKNEKGFIESTCMMEPGDSGGPLFDYLGRVIGLRSAIEPDEKKNYDVPVDLYRKYWAALLQPVHYLKYPEIRDSINTDPSEGLISSHDQLESLRLTMKTNKLNKMASVQVESVAGNQQRSINGLLIDVKGQSFVVSKNSEVAQEPLVLYNGKSIKTRIIARDKENDLVLLGLDAHVKGGIAFPVNGPVAIGRGVFLLSPQPDTLAIASVFGKDTFSLPKMSSLGFLGAAIAPDKQPLVLTYVMPGSPADAKGATPGDEIISINGVAVNEPMDYGRELSAYWPGDTVIIKRRLHAVAEGTDGVAGKVHQVAEVNDTIVLAKRPQLPATHATDLFRGGKSERRDGFQSVIAHDAILRPEQCGGPVFTTAGVLAGINIARHSRTVTLAVPAALVQAFVLQNIGVKH
ncbi:trypsin-like peptidase domain-containing protein [Chitinophaga pinensis]|uniref:PDZ/DHR/GLGF domain protein n=1 Tax=Chitinophaga pinensis (strain ATCC 43595 / DSM 2588 / LMG 13176 / NBRC 15968 / NCIMB 11800 / UQM 2034) TaxID=485918 RepID=A0A979G8N2_CHIPD|nr:trypsin-like peptidase domain-containing protein [Chitinophaga pinensis]ACU62698.1 PDZ/DHR/GLGF domain protein [Chitinophaga pinensis DSM 2588]